MSTRQRINIMKDRQGIINGIGDDIQRLLYDYVEAKSYTNTADEKEAENFLLEHFAAIPYFAEHSDYYGAYPIPGDGYGRAVCFAMVKGEGSDTVVFVHHSDVVDIEDFKLLKPFAFRPDELREELMKIKDDLSMEARGDLESGEFIFGRGVADMKGGGSIQISLLERYSRQEDFKGNVIVIMVPDEENLSAGMRAAVKLLADLQDKYGLNYKLMINSEPHQRKARDEGIFSEGSVGKIMPFVYVRGNLSHIGKVFEGLNPVNLLSEIVRRTELNMDFSDVVGDECAPPPTWLHMKDSKVHYDVSMPLSMYGCFSILTLTQTPEEVMEKVRKVCEESFETVLSDMNASYEEFSSKTRPVAESLPWQVKVSSFGELYEEAVRSYGDAFIEEYSKKTEAIAGDIACKAINIIDGNRMILEFVYDYICDFSPRIVYGLIPPYYPSVSNLFFDEEIGDRFYNVITDYAKQKFGQRYVREYFYTGISDLSYTNIEDGRGAAETFRKYMPLFGMSYDIPFEAIEKISMPCINVGPWGKDFHKLTERVSKEDLYIRTPAIVNEMVFNVLEG